MTENELFAAQEEFANWVAIMTGMKAQLVDAGWQPDHAELMVIEASGRHRMEPRTSEIDPLLVPIGAVEAPEQHTRCAIYRTHGLALGAKYQVFANGPSGTMFTHLDHPDYQFFVVATRTLRDARTRARRYLNPEEPPSRLVAILRRKETR
jgi:hypothetical protein